MGAGAHRTPGRFPHKSDVLQSHASLHCACTISRPDTAQPVAQHWLCSLRLATWRPCTCTLWLLSFTKYYTSWRSFIGKWQKQKKSMKKRVTKGVFDSHVLWLAFQSHQPTLICAWCADQERRVKTNQFTESHRQARPQRENQFCFRSQ